jgi:hypothetical protein
MPQPKFPFPVLLAITLTACSHASPSQPTATRKTSSAAPGCTEAHRAALDSRSPDDASAAIESCKQAAALACQAYLEKYAEHPDDEDGRYIAATCAMNAALGANKAVNRGRASAKCIEAYGRALAGTSIALVFRGTKICRDDKTAICAKNAEDPVACDLTAAYGAYFEIPKK